MPEYHVLRAALGILEALLAIQIWKRNHGSVLWFMMALYWHAAGNIIPASLGDQNWWSYLWLPLAALSIGLAAAVSVELFAFMKGRTNLDEKIFLGIFSGGAGTLLVLLAWWWMPEDGFQVGAGIVQYTCLGLAAAFSIAWWWANVHAPIAGPRLPNHGLLWAWWLWVGALASCSFKGGLLWAAFEWKGGGLIWRIWNDGAVGVQLLLVGCWFFSVRRWPRVPAWLVLAASDQSANAQIPIFRPRWPPSAHPGHPDAL